jgi:hypothetical protein
LVSAKKLITGWIDETLSSFFGNLCLLLILQQRHHQKIELSIWTTFYIFEDDRKP